MCFQGLRVILFKKNKILENSPRGNFSFRRILSGSYGCVGKHHSDQRVTLQVATVTATTESDPDNWTVIHQKDKTTKS